MKRYIFVHARQIMDTFNRFPALGQINALSPIVNAMNNLPKAQQGKCNCGGKMQEFNNNFKIAFDTAIHSLSDGDKNRVKNALGVDQVCYYSRRNKGVALDCF